MPARFHVTHNCVNMVDVDPRFREAANQENIEFTVAGYLIDGDVMPGMLANIRPHLRRGKYYRVRSIETFDPPPELLTTIKMPEEVKHELMTSDMFTKTSYYLTFICSEQSEFEGLVAMNIHDEDIELFHDAE